MGTDIYHCSIQSHRVLDKEAAIRRAVAYGFGPQSPPAVLAAHEGPFLEITLDMRSVYFDAPVSWDPLMLLRFLDEAVYHAARYDQSGFDFENTPISRRYPGLWTMGFKAPRELGEDITLVQIERTEPPSPPGPRRDWTDDRARAVFFVPEHLAPNLASFGFWESRAWGGHSWDAERQLTDLRPWQCEARLVEGVAGLSAIVGQATSYPDGLHRPALCPRAAGGLWLCNGMELYRLDPGGLNATHVGSLPRPQMKMFATACREDRDGTLWIGTNKGLLSYKPHTGFQIETTGHAGKELHALALTPDGRVVVAGVGGIWIREEDGSFTHVREGLLDTTVDHLVVDDEGVMWASGSKGLSRRTPDGGVERFQKTQGVGPSPRILPLPDGAVYITSYGGTGRIARGGSRAEPHSGLDGALARGVAAGTRGPDGVVWALSSAGMLLRLRADEPPRAVALVPPIEDTWHARLLATADGDLWVMLQSRLLRYSAADQTRADASPPLDSRPVPPLQLSPPPKAASGIDFRGKVVVLTGTFSRLSRDEAAALLSAHGANVGSGVTAKTDYLIAGKGAGSKATKAAKLGVTVLGEDALPTP